MSFVSDEGVLLWVAGAACAVAVLVAWMPPRAYAGALELGRLAESLLLPSSILDAVTRITERSPLMRAAKAAAIASLWIAFLLPAMTVAIVLRPGLLRAGLVCAGAPYFGALAYWTLIAPLLDAVAGRAAGRRGDALRPGSTLNLLGTGLCIAAGIAATALLVGRVAPGLARWALGGADAAGVLTVPSFCLAVSLAVLVATLLTVLHVEGNGGQLRGGRHDDVGETHRKTMAACGVAAAAVFLLLPIINRPAFARMRLSEALRSAAPASLSPVPSWLAAVAPPFPAPARPAPLPGAPV